MKRDTSSADGPAMNGASLDRFLARPLLARLATSQDGQPRVLPMWFLWDGEVVWMETSPTFPNVRILRENPRAALAVDEALGGLQFRAVLMQGNVEVIDAPAEQVFETVRRIYARYLTSRELRRDGETMLRGSSHVLLRFVPRVIKSWDTTA